MKNKIFTNVFVVMFIFFGVSSTGMAQEIPLISEVDFSDASREAASSNKRLLFIYKQDNCEECEQFISTLAEKQDNPKYRQFAIYQANTNTGIDVVCPDGLELSDGEFFTAKGIHGKLSLVFHDESGDVVYTHNGIPSETKLVALMEFVRDEQYADSRKFIPNR